MISKGLIVHRTMIGGGGGVRDFWLVKLSQPTSAIGLSFTSQATFLIVFKTWKFFFSKSVDSVSGLICKRIMKVLLDFLLSVHPITSNLDQYSQLLRFLLGERFNNSTYFVSILLQVCLNCIDCKSATKASSILHKLILIVAVINSFALLKYNCLKRLTNFDLRWPIPLLF